MPSFVNTTSGNNLTDQIRQLNTNITAGFRQLSSDIGSFVRTAGGGGSAIGGSPFSAPQFPSRYMNMPDQAAGTLHGGLARLAWESIKPHQLLGSDRPQWMSQHEWQQITRQQLGTRVSEGLTGVAAGSVGLGGMGAGALVGSLGGPVGTVVGGMVGSMIGDYVGADMRRNIEYRNLIRGLDDRLVRGARYSRGIGGTGLDDREVRSMARQLNRLEQGTGYFESGQGAEFMAVGTQLGIFENAKSGQEVIDMIRDFEPVIEQIATTFKTSIEESTKIFKQFQDTMPDPRRAIEDIKVSAGLWGIDPQLTAAGMQMGADYARRRPDTGLLFGQRVGGAALTGTHITQREGRFPRFLMDEAGGPEAVAMTTTDLLANVFDRRYLAAAYDRETGGLDFSRVEGLSRDEIATQSFVGWTHQDLLDFQSRYPMLRRQFEQEHSPGDLAGRFFQMYGEGSAHWKSMRSEHRDDQSYWQTILRGYNVAPNQRLSVLNELTQMPERERLEDRQRSRDDIESRRMRRDRRPVGVTREWRRGLQWIFGRRGRRDESHIEISEGRQEQLREELPSLMGLMDEGRESHTIGFETMRDVHGRARQHMRVPQSVADEFEELYGMSIHEGYNISARRRGRGRVTVGNLLEDAFDPAMRGILKEAEEYSPGGYGDMREVRDLMLDFTPENRTRFESLRRLADPNADVRGIVDDFFSNASQQERNRFVQDQARREAFVEAILRAERLGDYQSTREAYHTKGEDIGEALDEMNIQTYGARMSFRDEDELRAEARWHYLGEETEGYRQQQGFGLVGRIRRRRRRNEWRSLGVSDEAITKLGMARLTPDTIERIDYFQTGIRKLAAGMESPQQVEEALREMGLPITGEESERVHELAQREIAEGDYQRHYERDKEMRSLTMGIVRREDDQEGDKPPPLDELEGEALQQAQAGILSDLSKSIQKLTAYLEGQGSKSDSPWIGGVGY